MASISVQSDSTLTRPLALRMRPDLTVHEQRTGLRRCWVVKDPVSLRYFHLRDEEHAILRMLDGRVSLDQIKRQFERVFAPLQLGVEQLHAFLGRLHRNGLLIADAPSQGDRLLEGHRDRRRRALIGRLTGVLAVRFRGIDPEPLLGWLYPKCRWIFSPLTLGACLTLVVGAILLMAVQFNVLTSRLPEFRAFFTPVNAVYLVAVLAGVKVLHEMGHALTCKHFGGECHEMGLMLLVFTPCLYCNVSDSWLLPGKWQRIAVAAAGIGVELVLAAAATLLWWFSEPGLLNMLCLNVMFVCSISTLVFNGNPLLRYDGYFVLSDLLEVPNLHQQSRALLVRGLARFFLGLELHDERAVPDRRRGLLTAYAVASTLYRWVVVIAILWFCRRVLKSYRLEPLAVALAAVVVIGMMMAPVLSGARLLRNPAWRGAVRRRRAALTLGLLAAAVIGIGLVPLPHRVTAPSVLEPADVHRVYVSAPGVLMPDVPMAAAGTAVSANQTLARLDSPDRRMEIAQLQAQYRQRQLRLEHLKAQLEIDPAAVSPQIPAAKAAVDDLMGRLRQREDDLARLELKSPIAGTVLPPPSVPRPAFGSGISEAGALGAWWGHPLQAHNRGCYLETGTLLAMVGDPTRLEAMLAVDQADVEYVRAGQRVKLRLAELPAEVIWGTVSQPPRTDLKTVPRELAAGGELPARVDAQGFARPLQTTYYARVVLDDHDARLLTGTRGRAKIMVDSQSLARRLVRYLGRTFRFHW